MIGATIIGKAFVLGNDIDTDQIIPAGHLVYSLEDPEEQKLYGQFALSGVPLANSGLPTGGIPFVPAGETQSRFKLIIAGKNFGCGSSREHAPFALQMAGVQAIVATSYARIFYRNAVDGGFLLPLESEIDLAQEIATGDAIEIDMKRLQLNDRTTDQIFQLKSFGDIGEIANAGGIFEYARKNGMVSRRKT